MSSTVISFNLPYSYKIDPKATNKTAGFQTYYETTTGLWREHKNPENGESYYTMDNLAQLVDEINKVNKAVASDLDFAEYTNPSLNNQQIAVTIRGSEEFAKEAKSSILRKYNSLAVKTIEITETEFMMIDENFVTEMKNLCTRFQVEVIINNKRFTQGGQETAPASGPVYCIHIVGYIENVTQCETGLKVLIDSCLNKYVVDAYSLPLSMVPIIGGFELKNFSEVALQTNSNIYVPDLLPNLFNSNIVSGNGDLHLWLTAKNAVELLLAKSILDKLIASEPQLKTKSLSIDNWKLNLMIMNNQKEIIDLMLKYAVFIQLPSLGENDSTEVIVQGTNPETIDECIKEVSLITAQYYTASFSSGAASQVLEACHYTSECILKSTSEVGVEIVGKSQRIKALLNSSLKSFPTTVRLELNNDQKDFISGKKNGKLVKILNQTSNIPTITFSNNNDYNLYIEVASPRADIAVKAIELIELELPSEYKYFIPEIFHRAVIGGGSVIQAITKRYNVFTKFSSVCNQSTNAYSLRREPNVLIKCPRKNMQNIPLVKHEIDQLVYQYSMNDAYQQRKTTVYYNIKFQIMKHHYLLLVNNNKLPLINRLEQEYNSFIDFPTSINNFKSSNVIEFNIKGAEGKIKSCAKQLANLVLPQSYEFKFAANKIKYHGCFKNSRDFEEQVVIPFKLLLGYDIIVNETPLDSQLPYHQIMMSYYDNSKLPEAIEAMTYWLRERGFLIYEKSQMSYNPILESTMPSPTRSNMMPVSMPAPMQVQFSPIPLQPISNTTFNNISPTGSPIRKLQQLASPPALGSSPSNQGYYMVSPSRQQLMMRSSPVKSNFSSPQFAPQSPTRPSRARYNGQVGGYDQLSPVKLSPSKFQSLARPVYAMNTYVYNV
ncbi:uncharacterized protein LODBEIA_P33020 [Lodderomyces beijingensis]|uniref:Mug60/KHD4 KH type I domain-containing protein n=1 Tax=Lodderomyces beijingensis TaxID=1775926 RepID=A0ABP0ZN25_9ASCO